MITRNFNLYLNAGHSVPPVINVNQYDSGEQWVFTLYNSDGTKYTPSTGAIVGIKSDGLGIINSGSVVDGKVVINETQQMTAAVGKAVFELMIDSQTHGTANFIVLVEPKPGDNADLSESDLSLIQQAIDSTSPAAIAEGVSDWMDEHLTPTTPVVDDTLTVQGAAADAKKTGDEISDLKSAVEQIDGGTGVSADLKAALLQLAQKVAYIDDDGQTYYDDLYDALYPPIVVTNITLNTNSLSFGALNSTQQLIATTTPTGGAVTWSSSNTSVATVSATGLVTAIGYGNATITATSGSVSATCSVAIAQATVTSISAVYTQSGTVYDTDSLDSLKSDLVVTATWSNQTTSTVASADYTLSGTLTEGTSTITVSYANKTTTFNVTVTENPNISYTFTIVEGEYIPSRSGSAIAVDQAGKYSRTAIVSCKGATEINITPPSSPVSGGYTGGTFTEGEGTTTTATTTNLLNSSTLNTLKRLYFAISAPTKEALEAWIQEANIYGSKNALVEGWTSGVAYAPFEIVEGSYIGAAADQGAIKTSSTWCRTKFIDCHGAASITFPAFSSTNVKYNAFYDENRAYVESFNLASTEKTITVPSNAYYFCVSGEPETMQAYVVAQTIPHGE